MKKAIYSTSLLLLSIISQVATFKGIILFLNPQRGAGNYELLLSITTVIFVTTTIYRVIYNMPMKNPETINETMTSEASDICLGLSNILFVINEVLIVLLFAFAFIDTGMPATIFGFFFTDYGLANILQYIFYLIIWIVPSIIINFFKGNSTSKLSYMTIVCVCIIMSFSANVYFSEAVNKHVVIDFKEKMAGSRIPRYSIGSEEEPFNLIDVNWPEYNSIEVGDEVVFCCHKSIFGIRFLDIKNDDNQICKYKNDMLPIKKDKKIIGLLLFGIFPLLLSAFAVINTFNYRFSFRLSGIKIPYGCRKKVEEACFRGDKENDVTITSLTTMSISKKYIIKKNNLKKPDKNLSEIIGDNFFKYGIDSIFYHMDFSECRYCVISDDFSKIVLIYDLMKNKLWIIEDSMDIIDYSIDEEAAAEGCVEKFLNMYFTEWKMESSDLQNMKAYESITIAQKYEDSKAARIITLNYRESEDLLSDIEEVWTWTLTKKDSKEWKIRKIIDNSGNDLYCDK
ncbi:MAG TPA: hypothetical protein GX736_02365 [Mogibacterium sp.]|nr:hypothetical protein [Mogibacterium sp.]